MIFSLLSMTLHPLLIMYKTHIHQKTSYLSAYTQSLSGIRLAPTLWNSIPILDITEPIASDFSNITPLKWESFSFIFIKNSDYLYSYSQHQNQRCIIRARHENDHGKIHLFDQEFYFNL
ncbi:hypothetical protein DID78_02470 [Candidatus Marinamargulisbacteria bacterium SCGC AG-343-D04]|nr:hypothetical protein DID78_02470 [Candidatus Marinamargulisbacteria bacterium SCGC AG-343-D04]